MAVEVLPLPGELTADRWSRLKSVFIAAVDVEPGERSEFIAGECGGDEALRGAVEALLANDAAASSFMERSPIGEVLAPAPARDLENLLRYRLQIATWIALGGNGLFFALRFLRLNFTPVTIWLTMAPGAVYLGLLVLLGITIRRSEAPPLRRLRALEAVLVGLTTVYFVGETFTPLFIDPAWVHVYAVRHPSEISILARQPTLFWIFLIVGYGTLIPNTGRRCAVVTASIGTAALATIAIGGLLDPVLPSRLLALMLSEMSIWIGCAVALAIYGSHKIAVLREEALAARTLGQYRLKHRLGHGGMGEVYLAEHILLKRPCAVKVIRPERAHDRATLQRFLREVQVTATLTHPNTVQVFDYGQAADGTVYYAMEYLIGPSLEALVAARGPLPAARAIYILRQICGALGEAHAAGLVHCDIKPANVIVCERGGLHDVAKLLDFGLARIVPTAAAGQDPTVGTVFGTPSYMSPEQAAGRSSVERSSDIYGFGALGYFLLTGGPPFIRPSAVETLAAHISAPVEPPAHRQAGIPDDLNAVIVRCLTKNPEDRYRDAGALDAALASCAAAGEWNEALAADWWGTTDAASFDGLEDDVAFVERLA